MVIVEVCRTYKWDFYKYLAQPSWFLDLIHQRMQIDAKKAEAESRKAKQGKH